MKKVKNYEEIYDYICNYLDEILKEKNYCDFIDGKCVANRLKISVRSNNGCCYNRKEGLCKYLVNGKCTNSNVSCKLFMCSYLEKQGIKLKINDIPNIKKLLNKRERNILEKSFFKTKEEVIKLLIKKDL